MKSKFVIIICIGILSVFIFMTRSTSNVDNVDENEIERRAKDFKSKAHFVRMNDQPKHLFWFVQISDIHISIFTDEQRIHDFRKFATETLDTIKPPVVVASGDLTDARGKGFFASQQYEEEWKTYDEILKSSNVKNKTIWLDLRGNHDNFNVPLSNKTYFKQYSIQGAKHKRSYMEIVRDKSGEQYAFIAVDASLEPGPKRPYNFIGLLDQNDTDHLQHLVDEAKRAGVNYTVWFGHYPTTCVVTRNKESRSLKRMIGDYDTSLAYLCGHLHSLAGMVPRMYVLQSNSFLELEVADWKACRKYRVAAIDHGLISFVDIKHGTWPVILITNPKHSLFQIPHRSETKIQLDSTHIRLLAFSPSGIRSCSVKIGEAFKEHCKQINDHFFAVQWNPKRFQHGLHYITATVVDNDGRENEVTQPFRLDENESASFDFMAKFVLQNDAIAIFSAFFWISFVLCVAPLIFFRIWHELVNYGFLSKRRATCRSSVSCIQQYWILSSVDRLFWPVVLYCIYLAVGPLVIYEVVDGSYGAVFIWGVYLNGTIIPGSLTYIYGFIQLSLCEFPLIWFYSKCVAKRYYQVIGMPTKNHRGWCSTNKISKVMFYMIIATEILLAIFFGILNGAVAFFLGFFRTWSVVLNIYLWYLARNVPEHALRSAVLAWSGSDKTLNENQSTETNETNDNHTN